jgi:CubicO group peptidase (beta-lactamase class C family)
VIPQQTSTTRFAKALHILEEAIATNAFPGASFSITHKEQIHLAALGNFTYDANSSRVAEHTIFDLASLTKVVATTTTAMILYERGILHLEIALADLVPEFVQAVPNDARRTRVTLRMLLAHSSGLPAYEKLFLHHRTRNALLDAAFEVPLTADPGSRAEYSDIGFILLGVALERLAGQPLDTFCQREVFAPLKMTYAFFNPPKPLHSSIPPTVDDTAFRHRIIQGEVNDENAGVLGGVAGHAGLFSNAHDLALFAQTMLRGGSPIVHPETVALFTPRESSPAGTSRALGWDTPSYPSQSGTLLSPRAFGHLGYTGTSLWIDPERQLAVALLTNRTWPYADNQAIKQIRPKFHDSIVEALEKEQP